MLSITPELNESTSRSSTGATSPGTEHRTELIGDRPLHWVSAGDHGSPILLVHGFPETWWVFRHLVPLLAQTHHVVAVDLPGFGDSGTEPGDYSSAAVTETLHVLIGHLGLGPVHLSVQDVAGGIGFRLAARHPSDVLSLTAIETLLPGFGFERLADVAHGGAWHVGAIATPGVADLVLTGRVHRFLSEMWLPFMTRAAGSVTADDVAELGRAYERPGAWRGPQGLYSSALREGAELRDLAAAGALQVPVLAVDGFGTSSTAAGMRAVSDRVSAVLLDGVGHHVALEAPARLAEVMLAFVDDVDRGHDPATDGAPCSSPGVAPSR